MLTRRRIVKFVPREPAPDRWRFPIAEDVPELDPYRRIDWTDWDEMAIPANGYSHRETDPC